MTTRGLAFPALLLLGLAGGAVAQSDIPSTERSPDDGEAGARVVPPPDWSIRPEVERLDTSMREYSSLINSLSRASDELGTEFQTYLEDPNDEVQASVVERKMADYAATVSRDFDDIIADQDILSANFRDLERKLQSFSEHLDGKAGEFDAKLSGYRTEAQALDERLVELAVTIRENPPEDEDELRELKREFAREFRRYRLQTRYVNGYQRRYQNYQRLSRNVRTLAGLFVNLHEKFNELIENLENEKQYLEDSMELQADQLRIKQIMRDGILGSETAIGNVADKLANLYHKVDAFTQVHDRINGDLNRFVESQEGLLEVTRRIDAIGATGGPIGDLAADMEAAIDHFHDRQFSGDDELVGVDEIFEEDGAAEGAEGDGRE